MENNVKKQYMNDNIFHSFPPSNFFILIFVDTVASAMGIDVFWDLLCK